MATAKASGYVPRLKESYDGEIRARLKDELGLSSTRVMAEGLAMVRDWERSFPAALDVLVEQSRTLPGEYGLQKSYGWVFLWAAHLPDTPFGRDVKCMLARHASTSFPIRRGTIRFDFETHAPREFTLLEAAEKFFPARGNASSFRSGLVSRIGAYAVDHPEERPLDFRRIFPDLFRTMRRAYFDQRRDAVTRVQRHLLLSGTPEFAALPDADRKNAERTLENLSGRGGFAQP